MVEADKTKAFAEGNEKTLLFWEAETLAFVPINHSRDIREKCGIPDSISCFDFDVHYTGELSFVRWYGVLNNKNVLSDDIDDVLECAGRKWHRPYGSTRNLS